MNEINERDLEQVTGGIRYADAVSEFQRRNCLNCSARNKKPCMTDARNSILRAIDHGEEPDLNCRRRPA